RPAVERTTTAPARRQGRLSQSGRPLRRTRWRKHASADSLGHSMLHCEATPVRSTMNECELDVNRSHTHVGLRRIPNRSNLVEAPNTEGLKRIITDTDAQFGLIQGTAW